MTKIYDTRELRRKEPRFRSEVINELGKFRTCQICHGSMKKGKVIRCKCGRFFHKSCLETITWECPRCGTFIHLVEEGKGEEGAAKGTEP